MPPLPDSSDLSHNALNTGGKSGGGMMRNRSKRSKRLKQEMAEVTTRGEIRRVQQLAPYLKKQK